ncbi:hypothetical protein D915_001483 [Fasciola hepatica]|uniref:Apple domain-containing protein n=1 Tax=Fasciola hepatica TaxID=6192 RepID=A0A4E0RX56_FASHE|nr:hypothetical protein D915_001483 [Fasciola hepatica]
MLGIMLGQCINEYLEKRNISSTVWINLHALHVHGTNTTQSIWKYGDTDQPRSMLEMKRNPIIPFRDDKGSHRLAILRRNNNLEQLELQSFEYSVICQIVDQQNSRENIHVERFRRAYLPADQNWLAMSAWQIGCFERQKGQTLIICAMRCQMNPKCRNFYFNEELQRCTHTHYVDSLLGKKWGSGKSTGWLKYERRSFIFFS